MTTIWMTGATGFVGSHFLLHVLQHSDAAVVALVREQGAECGRARLLRVLERTAWSQRRSLKRSALRRLQVICADITAPACGVVPEPSGTDEHVFWHLAASLQFEDRYEPQIRAHNVDGTRHALELATQLGVSCFVYVSTAYTCGRRIGEIPEQLHPLAQEFNNAYERSKCEAEHEVARWSERTGCPAAIVRPSIVVGPVATHLSGGSDSGLYGFAREVYRIRRVLAAAGESLVMLGEAAAPVNLIPVDVLAREMWQLSAAGFSGGLVHHLTSDRHPNVERLLEVVGRECGAGPIAVLAERSRPASPVERLMDRRARFYSNYLRGAKTFARRAGSPIHVSDDDLQSFVRGFVQERRGQVADTLFERHVLTAPDGEALVAYSVGPGDAPVLLCCNAYGVAADVWVPLAKSLADEHRVISWELREPGPGRPTLDSHVRDLQAIMQQLAVERAYLAGFCTGADLAVRFAELHPERVQGLVSVSGALNSAHASETVFQRHMRTLAASTARDLAHAQLYHRLLFGQRQGAADDEAMLVSMVSQLDADLIHLTSQPFRDPVSLHTYGRHMQGHYEQCARSPLPKLELPALLVLSSHDPIAHPDASRVAHSAWRNATRLELEGADHFAIYTNQTVWQAIRSFIRQPGSSVRTSRAQCAA